MEEMIVPFIELGQKHKMKTFSVYSIHDYDLICTYILSEYKNKIFLLNGELGSGKTTFVQFFCKKLG